MDWKQTGHDAPARVGLNAPRRYDVMIEMGDCYAGLDDAPAARRYYRQAMALDPARAKPHIGLGVLALQAGRSAEALEAFTQAARTEPDCAEAYGGLAMVHQQQGRYAEAFEMYLTCLELDADNLTALLGLFQTSCQMGTFAKVIHFLEVYLDRHPDDASVLFCLASLYVKEDRLHDARDALRRTVAMEPDKSEAAELLRDLERRLAADETAGVLNR
ncbi:MAG: tetratricopeptide repeat protein [Phycisphaerae bacterium]|nr:tetratricopeptide repeat protein [Phycisphaerae bacterium]